MNLKVSYKWVKEYLQTDKSLTDFVREFSLKSQTVDRVEEIKPKFNGVITAKILEVSPHPNADKLRLATIDTAKSKLTVVCGAPNISAGQVVPFAMEGAVVLDPEGKEFKVGKAVIRGVESRGMLCSQKELGIGNDHAGIMILPPETALGKLLETILPLNDQILDIEITSNRPDAMSVVGLAREAAAALGAKLTYKEPKPDLKISQKLALRVEVKELKLCSRYQAVVMSGVSVKPSPLWLQWRLLASGIRPINNLVDITNYILLEYGRPMHVFDYDKITGQKIIVRLAKAGEKILALDGNTYELKPSHLVIADAKVPIAVGGVMGGEDSAAVAETKNIVFEAAIFDPVLIRKTARDLNLHSESSDLFEKGLNPASTTAGILRAIELTQKIAGGKVASAISDSNSKKYNPAKIKFNPAIIRRYLGIDVPVAKIKTILVSLGFGVSGSKILTVAVPYWRAGDIAFDYDLVEEIARIYGYHNLPTKLPSGELPGRLKDELFFWEDKVKDILVGLGFTEIYSYSLVSKELLAKVKFSTAKAVKIFNPLNEEMEYLRTTLLSQTLKNIADNLKNFSGQKIFELSNIYLSEKTNDLPLETPKLTGAVVSGSQNDFFEAKGVIELLLKKIGFSRFDFVPTDAKCPLWQTGGALDILVDGKYVGQFGLVNSQILENFGIKVPVALFDFDFKILAGLAKTNKAYQSLPEYPSVTRDLAIVINEDITWQKVSDLVNQVNRLIVSVEYLSTFTDSTLGQGKKSLAFKLTFRAADRTLKSEEVDEIIKKIVEKLQKEFSAKLR
ncbi:MAG: phenylalanine--tRNA ligase subunit beta [Patescibacteria group bacterium]|jgi:phenylalanyl-tRNA synthetase beta chain